ncbi:MAG: AraC family transcriptional regulator [Salinivirgaceae bacterium]|nr:AraC family transcriptional regulator [Salinivirgaceae bacterium]
METIVLIGSILGILNSFILITYSLISKKGNRKTNIIFALFIIMLTLRISKSILLAFSDGLHDFLLTIGLSGFMAIGPVYYFLIESITHDKFKFRCSQINHFLPALLFTFMWMFLDDIRNNAAAWHIFYRTILLQYMIYVTWSIYKLNTGNFSNAKVIKQLNIIGAFLLAIWFAYLLNEVSGFPYISGAILYSVLIYFTLIIVINKGYIIDLSNPKYKNTGLSAEESNRIKNELFNLLQNENIYRDNTISLGKIAKRLGAGNHALSQVINEYYKQSFFELIGQYRIDEAKILLRQDNAAKISEIAFDVGYNSLSAFNTAFKKSTGLTPSKFRNE